VTNGYADLRTGLFSEVNKMQREIDAALLSKPEAPDWAARVYGKQPFAGAGKSNSGFLVPLERRLAAYVLPRMPQLGRNLSPDASDAGLVGADCCALGIFRRATSGGYGWST
jgi:hypothetical protein